MFITIFCLYCAGEIKQFDIKNETFYQHKSLVLNSEYVAAAASVLPDGYLNHQFRPVINDMIMDKKMIYYDPCMDTMTNGKITVSYILNQTANFTQERKNDFNTTTWDLFITQMWLTLSPWEKLLAIIELYTSAHHYEPVVQKELLYRSMYILRKETLMGRFDYLFRRPILVTITRPQKYRLCKTKS